ncbi:hypothetical protein Q8F55_005837 [Vanrija albida]|uniref:F-box domain-containing protein n=1 Tax=Vanrija albida TaxID=181172 RepID=A0ABR3Q2P5_9TREE
MAAPPPPPYDAAEESEEAVGTQSGGNSAFLDLVGKGLSGRAGALQVLAKVEPNTKVLFLFANNLGSIGAEYLFEGLDRIRASHAGDPEPFGIRVVGLGVNNLRDAGLFEALGYAVNDPLLNTLNVDENSIELADADGFVELLNASNISSIRLSQNPLRTDSVITLFQGISSKVSSLELAGCHLQPACVPSIVSYFESHRSSRLKFLTISDNALGREGRAAILEAIERTNFTLEMLWVEENIEDPRPPFYGFGLVDAEEEARVERERAANLEAEHAAKRAVERIRSRNRELAVRTRMAAARVIAPARIVLHAVGAREGVTDHADSIHKSGSFPLLDLPREILLDIIRHCSRDAAALSQAQWLRIVAHAKERDTIKLLANKMRELSNEAHEALQRRELAGDMDSDDSNHYDEDPILETLFFWREQVGCVTWERDVPSSACDLGARLAKMT